MTFYLDSQSYGKKIGTQILTRFFSTKCPSLKFSENNGVNSHHCPNFALTKTFNDSHVIKKEHYLYKIVKPYS